ncbi:MAG TPA: DUF1553 domain-containing protein, partial [Planctomycetia bacterium]|nr:DUF1553 domain-containing protein [Planctomycetia bacterium]
MLASICLLSGVAMGAVDYVKEIKPILQSHCTVCHGALRQNGGLRLDTAALAKKGGDSGAAFEVGKAKSSALIHALRGEEGRDRMPQEAEPLAAAQIELISRWIDEGAKAPVEPVPPDPRDHWSFKPRKAIAPPSRAGVRNENPIDSFLTAERTKAGLTASPPADMATLLRRVTIDLVGLPPSADDYARFAADSRPDAYEREVDRLLALPAYGERWGRHWMDVWRYSDWAGFGAEHRESQKHVWRWRDWIVESLNADKGYDRMVQEMIAGDELAPGDPDVARATAYIGRNWYKFNRNVVLDNVSEHVGKAFLALTFNCARCHDHMYDPISQKEHFAFRAFFEPFDVRLDRVGGVADLEKDGLPRIYDKELAAPTYVFRRGNEKDPIKDKPVPPAPPAFLATAAPLKPAAVKLPTAAFYPDLRPEVCAAAMKVATEREEAAAKAVAKATADAKALAQAKLESAKASREALGARIAAETAKHQNPPAKDAKKLATEANRAEREQSFAEASENLQAAKADLKASLAKPDAAALKKAVEAATAKLTEAEQKLAAARQRLAKPGEEFAPLGPVYPKESTGRRLALAKWIVAAENPLAARVAINHIWMRHFGQPLVASVFDFGHNGRAPYHPALLDWLAESLVQGGWKMKSVHRQMVTSAAYRMSSAVKTGDPNLARDPDNKSYWRMNSRRMEAEAVRDSVLAIAGRLDRKMGGPDLDQQSGLTSFRRSLYYRHANEKQMLMLTTFDAAGVTECYRRNETIVPQQALALANGPLTRESSRLLEKPLGTGLGGK